MGIAQRKTVSASLKASVGTLLPRCSLLPRSVFAVFDGYSGEHCLPWLAHTMRVLPTAQHTLRQAAMELNATAFPSAIRTLASIIASITMVITIYLGYRKCMRGRGGSFTSERGRDLQFGIPVTSYEESGAYSEEYLPVYVGDGRYVYVSRNDLPRDPPHIDRRDLNVPPRFDPRTLKQFEAASEEKQHSCPICLEEQQAEAVSAGQCLHLMHTSCLTSWLNKDINSNCPVCRVRIEESASFDNLRGRVVELPSLAHPQSEKSADSQMETVRSRPGDVRLAMSDNVANMQTETDAIPQGIERGTIEGSCENNGGRDGSHHENREGISINEVDEEPRVADAGVLQGQGVRGALTAGGSRRVSGLGIEQEVAVASN
ncbi:Zinc finger RING-type [Gracilaria domingensis]|nr:Zinc finger RING-type [Gracilaria domingensis]